MRANTQSSMMSSMELDVKMTGEKRMVKVCLDCGYSASTKSFCKHKKKGQPCPFTVTKGDNCDNVVRKIADHQEVRSSFVLHLLL